MSSAENPPGENQPEAPKSGQQPASSPPAAPTKKKRNPIERAVVWIFILAILGFGAFELRGQQGRKRSMDDLTKELKRVSDEAIAPKKEDEEDNEIVLMSEESMDALMWFAPTKKVVENEEGKEGEDEKNKIKIVNVKWTGLLDTYEFQVGLDITDPEAPFVVLVNTEDHNLKRFRQDVVLRRGYFANLKSGANAAPAGGPGGGPGTKSKKANKGRGKKGKKSSGKTKTQTAPTGKKESKTKTKTDGKSKTKPKD